MRIHTTELYQFHELDDKAKDVAISENRDWNVSDFEWWDGVYEAAKEAAEILGIQIRDIYFTGFCSQGDGACFTGTYYYAKGAAQAIREAFPSDKTLHRIADDLQAAQRGAFYKLTAAIEHRGHYCHEYCADIAVSLDDDRRLSTAAEDAAIVEALREFMRWIYRELESEYEELTSDEAVRESLECNAVEFRKNGMPF